MTAMIHKFLSRATIDCLCMDKLISKAIIGWYMIVLAACVIHRGLGVSQGDVKIVVALFTLVLAVYHFWLLYYVVQKSPMKIFSLYTFFLGLYGLSFYLGNVSEIVLAYYMFLSLAVCLPLGILVCEIRDYSVVYKDILKITYVMSAILLAMGVYFFLISYRQYSQGVAACLLFPILYQINEIFRGRKRLLHVFLVVLQIGMIFQYGSRMALGSIFIFVFLKLLGNKRHRWSLAIGVGISLVFFAVVQSFGDVILVELKEWGLQSRVLFLLFSGQLFYFAGRDALWEVVWQMILQKPLLGWGIAGELNSLRLVDFNWMQATYPALDTMKVYSQMASSNFSILGGYPHNMFLELWVSTGIIIGTFLIYMFVATSIYALFEENRDDEKKDLVFIFFSILFVQFLFSGSCWFSVELFIFMGIAWPGIAKFKA